MWTALPVDLAPVDAADAVGVDLEPVEEGLAHEVGPSQHQHVFGVFQHHH